VNTALEAKADRLAESVAELTAAKQRQAAEITLLRAEAAEARAAEDAKRATAVTEAAEARAAMDALRAQLQVGAHCPALPPRASGLCPRRRSRLSTSGGTCGSIRARAGHRSRGSIDASTDALRALSEH